MNNNNMDPYSAGGQMPPSQFAPLPSGNDPAALEQVKGLCWGAFLLNWLWTWNNIGTMWGVIYLVVTLIPGLNFASFVASIFLLIKGNELAWTYRHFNSVEEFRAVQAAWVKYGLIVLGVVILLSIAAAVLFAGAAIQMGRM